MHWQGKDHQVLTEADYYGEHDESVGHGDERRNERINDELQRLR
jgi:hypothetical protein